MLNTYLKMLCGFNELNNSNEMISVVYNTSFINAQNCADEGKGFFENVKNELLIKRYDSEFHFYNYLIHQLFSRLLEMKSYSSVNINDTRRLITVTSDCISTIHILIRDEMHINVYFRSSDFDGALPCDLRFISEIPLKLIEHLTQYKNIKGYEEVTDELIELYKNKRIKVNLVFGSLHRIGETS